MTRAWLCLCPGIAIIECEWSIDSQMSLQHSTAKAEFNFAAV